MRTPGKILIVDDEPDILEFLSYNFKKKGLTVLTAANGVEGIAITKREKPQLIISDLFMPEMDGAEMCTLIKKDPELKGIPILFLTAANDDYKVLYAMSSGAEQYASKPIRFEYLFSLVDQLFYEKAEFFEV